MSWKFKAKGRPRYTPGKMNGVEATYEKLLKLKLLSNEILSYQFEPLKLKIADKTYYSPDFLVLTNEGIVEFHEVKGTSKGKPFCEDDAMVKIKACADKFPYFVFKLVWLVGGTWQCREI